MKTLRQPSEVEEVDKATQEQRAANMATECESAPFQMTDREQWLAKQECKNSRQETLDEVLAVLEEAKQAGWTFAGPIVAIDHDIVKAKIETLKELP